MIRSKSEEDERSEKSNTHPHTRKFKPMKEIAASDEERQPIYFTTSEVGSDHQKTT